MRDENSQSIRPLENAQEIVEGPNPLLREIRFFKISAQLNEDLSSGSDGSESILSPNSREDDASDIDVSIGLRTRQKGNSLGVRINFVASQDAWEVSLDVAANFESEDSFETTEYARKDFADKVGIMTLYPYIREAVSGMTQRTVGAAFILPTIRQGMISFTREENGSSSG